MKSMTEKMDDLFEDLKEILYRYDPAQTSCQYNGAEGEYEAEADDIVDDLEKDTNHKLHTDKEIEKVVQDNLDFYFKVPGLEDENGNAVTIPKEMMNECVASYRRHIG